MLTKTLIFTFAVVLLCGCSGKNTKNNDIYERDKFTATYKTLDEAESKLIDVLKSKYGGPDDYPTVLENRCYDELIDFVIKEPLTIDYPFERLQSEGYANIVTSEDGNLRLYYWNNETGGTWIFWSNICQYRCGDKVYAYEGSISNVKYGDQLEKSECESNCAILGIKTIYDKSNAPIYLVYTYERLSSNWGYRSIEAVQIKDGKLVAAPIFRGGIDSENFDAAADPIPQQCHRGTEYFIADWYFITNYGEGWDWLFQYDERTDILYVPQTMPDIADLTDRYSLYRNYDGCLQYIGTDGGFWLHPTIRSFKNLEILFDTKDYRIRIDCMFDDTYRYASWSNNRTMEDTPDTILYNGVYDEDRKVYRFRNNNYEYIVSTKTGVVVKHKGRTILSQSIKGIDM